MIKIGLTGGIASGKSLAEEFFQQEGAAVLDTDKVVHIILDSDKQVIEEIYRLFGEDVKTETGKIDRKKVAGIVFQDKDKLSALEKILHPRVKRIADEFLQKSQDKEIAVVSAPLLFEAGMESMFDFIVIVMADEEIRLQRLVQERNMPEQDALKRIRSLIFDDKKLKKADFIIENNSSVEHLRNSVKNIVLSVKSRL